LQSGFGFGVKDTANGRSRKRRMAEELPLKAKLL
jgi:hypothetical protein